MRKQQDEKGKLFEERESVVLKTEQRFYFCIDLWPWEESDEWERRERLFKAALLFNVNANYSTAVSQQEKLPWTEALVE